MAKVLKEEDFEEGKKPEDTSEPEPTPGEVIEGKEGEEPEKKVEPSKGDEESLPKPSDEKKYKHKTWEETEKARQELERGFTEKSMKLSATERELAELKRPKESIVTIDDRIKEMTKGTLSKIKSLPADSASRDEDAGYLWAKLQSDISDIKMEERERKHDTERDVIKRTYDRATKEGIKTDAELRILGYEFSKTDPSMSVDERISTAVNSTKETLSQIREGLVVKPDLEKLEKDKKDKEDLKVLGRGSSRREKSEEEKEGSETMSQALSKLNEQRRMKKEDLRW